MQRIVFQLDANLAKAFEQHSQQHDRSKAMLVRDWLDNLESVRFFKKDHTAETTKYHFRLDSDVVKKIDQRAKALSVSRSALLRNLIKTGLMKSQYTPWITDTYLMEKTYPQIVQLVSSYHEEPSIEMLLLEARANIEIGPIDIPHTKEALNKAKIISERHSGNYKILAEMKLLEGECFGIQGDLNHSLQLLNEAKMIAYANADYVFLSDVYYIIGLVQHLTRDIEGAIHTYENALEYITIQDHPLRVARVYLHLAMMYMFENDFKIAARYLARSKKVLTPQKTPHYFVIYEAVEGFFYSLQGNFEAAIKQLKKVFVDFKSMQSFFGMYSVAQSLGKTYLFLGKNREAIEIFRILQMQENTLGQAVSQSNAPLFLSFLDVEKDDDALEKIQNLVDLKKPYMKVEIEEYILACGLYIYGKTSNQKQKGERILRELAKKGGTALLQNSSKRTLKNKQIYPVTVI